MTEYNNTELRAGQVPDHLLVEAKRLIELSRRR
jgi:hypothetical protein